MYSLCTVSEKSSNYPKITNIIIVIVAKVAVVKILFIL